MELRSPDPACNPYLALAVCLAAGLDGIEKGMTSPEETTENIFAMDADDPRRQAASTACRGSLSESVDAMEKDAVVAEALGRHIFDYYTAGKRREWDDYRTAVSDWEIAKYIITY